LVILYEFRFLQQKSTLPFVLRQNYLSANAKMSNVNSCSALSYRPNL